RASPPSAEKGTLTAPRGPFRFSIRWPTPRGGRMSTAGGTQTVLITGATDGLGKAAALLLAERGYRVFAAGRSADKRAQLDALAKEKHLLLETMQMDVCDDASVQTAIASIYQKAGALDVLINNAGFVQVGAV